MQQLSFTYVIVQFIGSRNNHYAENQLTADIPWTIDIPPVYIAGQVLSRTRNVGPVRQIVPWANFSYRDLVQTQWTKFWAMMVGPGVLGGRDSQESDLP